MLCREWIRPFGEQYASEDPMADEHAAEPPPGSPGQRALGAMESAVRRARESAGIAPLPPPPPPPPPPTFRGQASTGPAGPPVSVPVTQLGGPAREAPRSLARGAARCRSEPLADPLRRRGRCPGRGRGNCPSGFIDRQS